MNTLSFDYSHKHDTASYTIADTILSTLQGGTSSLRKYVASVAGDMATILTIGRKGIKSGKGGYHSGSEAAYGQPPQQKKPHHGGDPENGGIYTPSNQKGGRGGR